MNLKPKESPNLSNLYRQLKMASCTAKDHPNPLLRVMSQSNRPNHLFSWCQPNQTARLVTFGPSQDLKYFLVLNPDHSLPHTNQLTSPFSISQLPKNMDESSSKHFTQQLGMIRSNTRLINHQSSNYNPSQPNQLTIINKIQRNPNQT